MADNDRLFWELVYRALMMFAAAIKKYKLCDHRNSGSN
jgi:hypothetical protein